MEVGRFDMDGGVELAMIYAYIDIQKCNFGGGGVPGEVDRRLLRHSRNWVRELGP